MSAAGWFSEREYAARLHKVKQRMQRQELDILICQDPANMCWLTGFDGWSFYTPQAVIVHVDEAWPLWFGRAQDAKSALMTTVLPADNVISFSEPLVHHPVEHPFDELCVLMRSRGWGDASIGVEMDAHYYTARAHRHIVDGLPDARIGDCRELVNWARAVKSPSELELMREAGRICTAAMECAVGKIAPGVAQAEIVADIYRAQVTGVGGKCGDYTSICPLIQVGEGTSTPHLTWTDQRLPHDTLVVIEIAGARHHYHAPLTRTVHLGQPPARVRDLAKVIVEGVDAGLEAARPGNTCEQVEAAWQAILRKNGYEKKSRVGYSIGLNFPPDWGERTMSLRPGDATELEQGMCFHFQSGVWLEDFGVAISESFEVGPRGGKRLCSVQRELIVID